MTRLAATMLLSACTGLGAYPVAPPHEADGGGGDAGETDAGPAGAGVEDCERELPPFDAGTSEGPIDDCLSLTEQLDDLFTAAGEPIYEHCYFDAKRDPCCGAVECADTEAEILFLDAVLAVAEARGYPPSMQLIGVGLGDDHAGAEFLVTIDWLEMRLGVS